MTELLKRKWFNWVMKDIISGSSRTRNNRLYKWRKSTRVLDKEVFPGNGKIANSDRQEQNSRLETQGCRIRTWYIKKIGIFSKNGRWFMFSLKTMKRYFRLKRCAKFSTLVRSYQWKSQSVSDRKQRVVLVKEK
jgi:hypothetical protein